MKAFSLFQLKYPLRPSFWFLIFVYDVEMSLLICTYFILSSNSRQAFRSQPLGSLSASQIPVPMPYFLSMWSLYCHFWHWLQYFSFIVFSFWRIFSYICTYLIFKHPSTLSAVQAQEYYFCIHTLLACVIFSKNHCSSLLTFLLALHTHPQAFLIWLVARFHS